MPLSEAAARLNSRVTASRYGGGNHVRYIAASSTHRKVEIR